jgi:hypothetical protein
MGKTRGQHNKENMVARERERERGEGAKRSGEL